MLDDLEGCVDAGSFGEGFHEGNVLLMVVQYLENNFIATDWYKALFRSLPHFSSASATTPVPG